MGVRKLLVVSALKQLLHSSSSVGCRSESHLCYAAKSGFSCDTVTRGPVSQRQNWIASGLLQRFGISTGRSLGDDEETVRSPLFQALGPVQESTGETSGVRKSAQAVLTGIRMSPQKLNMMAAMVRGMRVEDALNQMTVSVKRAAHTVGKVMQSAQANAVQNHNLIKERLVVAEAFVGKDKYLKRPRPHGKGKAGKMTRPRCRLTVILKEISPDAEADLARLRVLRKAGRKMTRREAKLVPHQLLLTKGTRKRSPPESQPPEATDL